MKALVTDGTGHQSDVFSTVFNEFGPYRKCSQWNLWGEMRAKLKSFSLKKYLTELRLKCNKAIKSSGKMHGYAAIYTTSTNTTTMSKGIIQFLRFPKYSNAPFGMWFTFTSQDFQEEKHLVNWQDFTIHPKKFNDVKKNNGIKIVMRAVWRKKHECGFFLTMAPKTTAVAGVIVDFLVAILMTLFLHATLCWLLFLGSTCNKCHFSHTSGGPSSHYCYYCPHSSY